VDFEWIRPEYHTYTMTPEAKVKKKVKQILDSFGCYHFYAFTGGYGRSGVPDIIACYKGRFIAVSNVKRERARPLHFKISISHKYEKIKDWH
jgi:hypothetical protein